MAHDIQLLKILPYETMVFSCIQYFPKKLSLQKDKPDVTEIVLNK